MSSQNPMTPLDLKNMVEAAVYQSLYPKWPKVLSGYFPFTVTKISNECVHVMFMYPVRREIIKGDEPAILSQNPRTRVWYHYGATAGGVPIKVGKLEGRRKAIYDKDIEYRKEWLKTHRLPATKYPMGYEHIRGIELLIHAQFIAALQDESE